MTVIVVDRDPVTRAKLKRRLGKIPGIAVIGEASESEEATAMIVNRKPDIVVLDTALKNGSGIEVLRHIKALLLHPTVIMVTSHPTQELRSACTVAGADFFFDKSVEDRKVVDTVRLLCVPDPEQDLSDPAGSLQG
jgi:DNA-binding NarL/FixJ family response regulator